MNSGMSPCRCMCTSIFSTARSRLRHIAQAWPPPRRRTPPRRTGARHQRTDRRWRASSCHEAHGVTPRASHCSRSLFRAASERPVPASRAAYSAAPISGGNSGAGTRRAAAPPPAPRESAHSIAAFSNTPPLCDTGSTTSPGTASARRVATTQSTSSSRRARRSPAAWRRRPARPRARAARTARSAARGCTARRRSWHRDRDRSRAQDARAPAVERPARRAPVAHAREQVHALARDPVGGALVADQLAPAAAARLSARVLAVGHRARAGDDADAIGAGERARPAANHVVAAAIARRVEQRRRHRVELRRSFRRPRRRRAGRRTHMSTSRRHADCPCASTALDAFDQQRRARSEARRRGDRRWRRRGLRAKRARPRRSSA